MILFLKENKKKDNFSLHKPPNIVRNNSRNKKYKTIHYVNTKKRNTNTPKDNFSLINPRNIVRNNSRNTNKRTIHKTNTKQYNSTNTILQ